MPRNISSNVLSGWSMWVFSFKLAGISWNLHANLAGYRTTCIFRIRQEKRKLSI